MHALDGAFHKALDPHYPLLREVQLCDYKVRILDPEAATGAKTRVLHRVRVPRRQPERWSTIGVSSNIIEASCDGARRRAGAAARPRARLTAQRAGTVTVPLPVSVPSCSCWTSGCGPANT